MRTHTKKAKRHAPHSVFVLYRRDRSRGHLPIDEVLTPRNGPSHRSPVCSSCFRTPHTRPDLQPPVHEHSRCQKLIAIGNPISSSGREVMARKFICHNRRSGPGRAAGVMLAADATANDPQSTDDAGNYGAKYHRGQVILELFGRAGIGLDQCSDEGFGVRR